MAVMLWLFAKAMRKYFGQGLRKLLNLGRRLCAFKKVKCGVLNASSSLFGFDRTRRLLEAVTVVVGCPLRWHCWPHDLASNAHPCSTGAAEMFILESEESEWLDTSAASAQSSRVCLIWQLDWGADATCHCGPVAGGLFSGSFLLWREGCLKDCCVSED